nr:maternal protein tudor-like isoform X2 [Osmia lignaria]XP_034196258.1 maternal protein tudor-like isoform X2 [Osmia lignaria]
MNIQKNLEEVIIFVTHVEAEGPFLKIWGQIDKNSATCVERMILPLVEQFTRSQGCIGPLAANLHINALCCARFQNEGYYRARVINIQPDGMVVLQFIDYGNIEVLPPQEIHLLDTIPGSESLKSFPPVAFDFALMNVLPINDVWENKIIESIKKSLWYNEYKILIGSVVNNYRFIKLWYNNEDFSELLIKKHMAIGATLHDMFRPKCIQQPPPSNCPTMTPIDNMNLLRSDGNEMHRYQPNVPLCCATLQKQMMQAPVQEALVFKSRVLDVPSKHDVYVSFVEDGPHKFSVHLISTSEILRVLMREINAHPLKPLQEPPLPGSVCLGRFTQDKVLCRAVVMSVTDSKCKLYYVDFGHTELLPYTDIFQLPPHFINPRVLSIRFTLSGVYELNATDEMKQYFKDIVSGKPLVLHVRPPEGPPLVQYGDLYDNEKNIKDILRQAFPTPGTMTPAAALTYQEPKKLLKGTEEDVLVSFVESCKKFFVQLQNNVKSLELVMNHLAEFCKTAPILSLSHLNIGLPCAALYDNQWYRAQIIGINQNSIKVLYVDYGNEETVPLSSLRFIREDLVKKLSAQAIKCVLNGWGLLPCTQELYDQFELMILEKSLRLRVVDVTANGVVVDLYEPETMEDIKSQMLQPTEDEKKVINQPNYETMEEQQPVKISPKMNQSESTNKWHKKDQSDSWRQPPNRDFAQEKNKFKTWKDESNEGKLNDARNDKGNFHRNDTRNERFNRDDFSNNRNTRDKWNNKNEYNDSFKGGRSPRGGGRNKTSGYGGFKNHSSSDKSWSDKDSDTSSKGSSRRGRNGSTRGYSKREGFSGRIQRDKYSDKENDRSFRGGKTNSDFSRGNDRFRDKKGQGYRLSQNKLNAVNSFSDGEPRRYSPMRNRNEVRIPSPNIDIGSTKTCEVVFTTSLSDFFIQLSPDYTALDSVMENIASIYEEGGELLKESEILSGVYCIAQYSVDLKWYRALIKSVEGNSATVQFVDYGNIETVEFDKIKVIQEEFLKLPAQAVHCKLLGLKDDALDNSRVKDFEDKVTEKTLEAEFIIEENGRYCVLLREVIEGWPTNTFINEEFCKNIDLQKAKEDALFSRKTSPTTKQFNLPDYASSDAKWTTISDILGTTKDAIITWFTNPNNFYCQVLDNETEFRTMMNEIQKIYVGREPVPSYTLQIGSSVIAIFSEDGALYRAEILELNKLNGHLVQYIDFGNSAVVNTNKIYPVEKKLMHLPKQAVHCSLLNIVPKDNQGWLKINTAAIDNCFNADRFECVFHDLKDDKYLISLSNNGNDVAATLVEKDLATFASESKSDAAVEGSDTTTSAVSPNVERVDINLLSGQVLRVKVSSVENASKFYVQLPSASECETRINSYMANKDPEVMQRLAAHEICLGTGCLIYSNGVWRRAVINNHSRTAGFDVKFIDTGACDEILSDSVLALPGELSVMQNQAIECSLADVVSSSETDNALKKHAEGKEVIICVNEVDNNRLIVKVFDLFGNKIKVSEDSDEKISPICPMPILSSTHKVSVSYADHSASIWLQRNAEYILDTNLSEALDQHYSTSGKLIEPTVGLVCAAKSVDGHWYRAKVIKCTENGVYVNFIDYGNNEEVTSDVVTALEPCFYIPHQLAINVSLPVTLNCPIPEQLSVLQNYLSNKELTAVFRNTNNKWVVELLDDGEKISDKFRSLNAEELSSTGKPYIHNMTVGSTYNVYVSHTDSPSQFWLQHVDDATELSTKQEELQEQAPTFPAVEGILEEGSLCVAVYTIDNLWYRAQVLDADEDITTVRFIDYGNTDIIDNKSVNIRQIPDSWKEIKEYSVKCRLDVIPVDSEDWNVTTCEKFENLVTSVESLQASIIANSIPKRVDLLINGKSISETLVEEHQAVKIHREEELIDEIVDLELDPHSAFVSHVNSPSEFWVQEEKSVGDLEVMTDRFIVAHMFPKVEEIKENLLCVAKYPEDGYWYRARVVSHSDNATRVIYIDYGNSATSTEICAIPEDLAIIPPLSRKCSLVMPEGITEWSQRACEEFTKLAADGATIFLLDVLKEDETSLVKLTLNGENVTDILANFCERFPPIIEERLPPLGEENSPNVFVTRVNSPDDFWIQTESSTADLNTMTDRLQAAPSFLPLNTFETGTICAAKYSEDEQWYRAKILSHSENGTEVLFIDYGNVEVTNETRVLPVDIINIPPLAKHCAMQKPNSISEWSQEMRKTFEELAADGETTFQFEILDDTNDPMHVKLSLEGTNVVDIITTYTEDESSDVVIAKEDSVKDENINKTADEETHEPVENDEAREQETEENVNNECSNMNSSVELTIDEIVQSMKPDELEEEETIESNNINLETNENDVVKKVTTDLEEQIEIQSSIDVNQTQKTEIDTEASKNDLETQNVNEKEVALNVIEVTKSDSVSTLVSTTTDLQNPEEEQTNISGSKIESIDNVRDTTELESPNKESVTTDEIEEICELQKDVQSSNLNEENTVEVESTSEQSAVTTDKIEEICELKKDVQSSNLNEENTAELESPNKESVTTDKIEEICELKKDKQDSNLNEENIIEVESTNEQYVTTDKKDEIRELKKDVESSNLNEENTLEVESTSEQSLTTDKKEEICELKKDVQSSNLNKESTAELESPKKESVTTDKKEEICELNKGIQNNNEENTAKLESTSEQHVTNDNKEETCELKTNTQSNNEENTELKAANEQSVTNDKKEEICELKKDIQSSNFNEESIAELESPKKESVTTDKKEEICESKKDERSNNLNEESSAKLESTSEHHVTNDNKEETCGLKTDIQSNNEENSELKTANEQSVTSDTCTEVSQIEVVNGDEINNEEKKSDSENCKLQDENKDNVSTTGPKDCSEIKADKVDKKECLDVQFVEIANNECSKIIDTPKTISLSDLSVSTNVEKKKDNENSLPSEGTSDSCK